ncbi:MADS-box transcription factor 17-like [Curcuma longa]|uniref:MADS-box transcription factor 17-like n=1 Tax=Curcuma longa TaxID=136217 RepID=UPI003D9DBC9D
MKKTSRGRQRIAMKAIEDATARQVCFSKRRAGMFKKANELSVLCGAELAVLAFSPSGKPFSFGHPSIDSVLARFLSASPAPPRHQPLVGALVRALSQQESQLAERLEAERRRKAALEAAIFRPWGSVADLLDAGVEALGLPELGLLQSALERVRAEAASRAEQLAIEALQPSSVAVKAAAFLTADAIAGAAPNLLDFDCAPKDYGFSCC